jgi:glycosyltransferase involved in cell wall biosynthesis
LPIVASDLAVHREICQDAAIYFQRFSPAELAEQVCRVAAKSEFSKQLSERGLARSRDFSWTKHVDELLALAEDLLSSKKSRAI